MSAAFDPPFDMLTHLSGSNASGGSVERGERVSPSGAGGRLGDTGDRANLRGGAGRVVIVQWGWRGSAGRRRGACSSLAAAARGFPVIAYEWNGGDELLEASVAHNGFGELVDVRVVRIGGRGEEYCRAIAASAETAARRTLAGPRGRAPAREVSTSTTSCWVSDAALERTRERLAEAAATRVDTTADAGVDGYARDDEGERDDGVRRLRSLLRLDPKAHPRMASSSVGSRPDAARAGSPHPREHLAQRGLARSTCEIAREARISRRHSRTGVGQKGVGPRVTVAAMRIGFGDGGGSGTSWRAPAEAPSAPRRRP